MYDTPIVCDSPCPRQALDPTPTNIIPNPCKWPRDEPSVENIRDPVKHTNQVSLPFHCASIKMRIDAVNIPVQMIDRDIDRRIRIVAHNGRVQQPILVIYNIRDSRRSVCQSKHPCRPKSPHFSSRSCCRGISDWFSSHRSATENSLECTFAFVADAAVAANEMH